MAFVSSAIPDLTDCEISHESKFHLRLVKQLGKGAYGVVYLAQDISRWRRGASHYAVKCLLRHPEGSDLARQTYREVAYHRAVADHPNVVGLHAVIEQGSYTFLILDYCSGGDLFGAIMNRGTYTRNTPAIKRTFLQILDAVAACHERGIYHRDLKPENILCSADDRQVYLADFGLATRSVRSSTFGCGSTFYMSPECLADTPHKRKPYRTAPSDVWALGTILCNITTRRNPWHVACAATDLGYTQFLQQREGWLLANLDISRKTAELLVRVFEPDPKRRVSLAELRVGVEGIKSFFPDVSASVGVGVDGPSVCEPRSAFSTSYRPFSGDPFRILPAAGSSTLAEEDVSRLEADEDEDARESFFDSDTEEDGPDETPPESNASSRSGEEDGNGDDASEGGDALGWSVVELGTPSLPPLSASVSPRSSADDVRLLTPDTLALDVGGAPSHLSLSLECIPAPVEREIIERAASSVAARRGGKVVRRMPRFVGRLVEGIAG